MILQPVLRSSISVIDLIKLPDVQPKLRSNGLGQKCAERNRNRVVMPVFHLNDGNNVVNGHIDLFGPDECPRNLGGCSIITLFCRVVLRQTFQFLNGGMDNDFGKSAPRNAHRELCGLVLLNHEFSSPELIDMVV